MKCFNCGERTARRGYQHVTKIGGFTVTDGTGMVQTCESCGEVSLSAEELAGYERRAARLILTTAKKPVSGEVLRYARKALGLRQKDLAALLQCNEQQVSRWENDSEIEMRLRLAMAALLDAIENRELGSVEEVAATPGRELHMRKAV